MTKENKFFQALQDVFIGAKVEGDIVSKSWIRVES